MLEKVISPRDLISRIITIIGGTLYAVVRKMLLALAFAAPRSVLEGVYTTTWTKFLLIYHNTPSSMCGFIIWKFSYESFMKASLSRDREDVKEIAGLFLEEETLQFKSRHPKERGNGVMFKRSSSSLHALIR